MTGNDWTGPTLAERFERRERIDSGGLGTVWRGRDRDTDAPVAIKCGHEGVHDGEQVRAQFRQELRWFRHVAGGPTPGSLVRFVDGSVGQDGSCVVTELIDGGSIDRLFDESGDERGEATRDRSPGSARSPGTDALCAVAPHVCRALDFLHRNGVLHLDCKPGNVLERRRGPPAVIDLNSAVAADAGTETLFHHDPYKPPELTPTALREEPAGPWSDVYALGKTCCFLLAGETPEFASADLDDWAAVDPREHGADCSAALAAVVQRATAPLPDDRFTDAGALYDALAPELGLPDRSAVLLDEASGQQIRVWPGATLGRWTANQRVPDVVVPDEQRLLSPAHATIEWDGSDWRLVDRSLNGTFVEAGSGWQYVLSEAGLDRRLAEDAPLPVDDPDHSIVIADDDRIAPVRPNTGCVLRFETR